MILFCVMSLCLGESGLLEQNFLYFLLLKGFFKNVMEYALPEATVVAKWECAWNGIRIRTL